MLTLLWKMMDDCFDYLVETFEGLFQDDNLCRNLVVGEGQCEDNLPHCQSGFHEDLKKVFRVSEKR